MTSLSAEFEKKRREEFIAAFREANPKLFPIVAASVKAAAEPGKVPDYSWSAPLRLSDLALRSLGLSPVEQGERG